MWNITGKGGWGETSVHKVWGVRFSCWGETGYQVGLLVYSETIGEILSVCELKMTYTVDK